eukprot:2306482-Amphidinium_carterae.1
MATSTSVSTSLVSTGNSGKRDAGHLDTLNDMDCEVRNKNRQLLLSIMHHFVPLGVQRPLDDVINVGLLSLQLASQHVDRFLGLTLTGHQEFPSFMRSMTGHISGFSDHPLLVIHSLSPHVGINVLRRVQQKLHLAQLQDS